MVVGKLGLISVTYTLGGSFAVSAAQDDKLRDMAGCFDAGGSSKT